MLTPVQNKHKTGKGEVKVLRKNKADSHKGENGRVLIIGGSRKYHGAPLLAAKMASKVVDLVYFYSIMRNNELLQSLKSEFCEFVAIDSAELEKTVEMADVVLIGPGLDGEVDLGEQVNLLLRQYPQKKFVLDADALKYLDKKLLGPNVVLTPHKGEFERIFEVKPTLENVKNMAQKYDCVIVLKGREDYVASKDDYKVNQTGVSGMTKGGTGDVLAGLTAALACKNDLFLAASAGVFVNGMAGERLSEKVGDYFNASDLIEEIPYVLKWGN